MHCWMCDIMSKKETRLNGFQNFQHGKKVNSNDSSERERGKGTAQETARGVHQMNEDTKYFHNFKDKIVQDN